MTSGLSKPLCGGTKPGDALLGRFISLASGVSGGIGTIGGLLEWFTKPDQHIWFTVGGFSYSAAIVSGAAAGSLLTAAAVVFSAINRLTKPEGVQACYAGVINNIVASFDSGWDTVFPFAAQHDRADVVVKPLYWEIITLRPSQYIWCNNDSLESPLLRSYFFSSEVLGAAIGSIIGAVAGAIGGFILGLLSGAAIGCAGGPILYLLAFLVALIVAAIVTLVGAFAAGNIGRAVAGDSSPTGTPTSSSGSSEISNGDYVSINGNLIAYAEDNNAIVAWWVDNTTISGRSSLGEGIGGNSPFSFIDPRDNYNPDSCRRITDTESPR